MQWHVTEGEAAERITDEAARRCAPGRPPWLHLRTRTKESEALIRTFAGHGSGVNACAFSPDGRRLVSASGDRTLRLWDTEAVREIVSISVSFPLMCVAVDSARPRLVVGDVAGIVSMVDVHDVAWGRGEGGGSAAAPLEPVRP